MKSGGSPCTRQQDWNKDGDSSSSGGHLLSKRATNQQVPLKFLSQKLRGPKDSPTWSSKMSKLCIRLNRDRSTATCLLGEILSRLWHILLSPQQPKWGWSNEIQYYPEYTYCTSAELCCFLGHPTPPPVAVWPCSVAVVGGAIRSALQTRYNSSRPFGTKFKASPLCLWSGAGYYSLRFVHCFFLMRTLK